MDIDIELLKTLIADREKIDRLIRKVVTGEDEEKPKLRRGRPRKERGEPEGSPQLTLAHASSGAESD